MPGFGTDLYDIVEYAKRSCFCPFFLDFLLTVTLLYGIIKL